MEAEQGSAGRAMVFRYPNYSEPPKQEDAVKLARFIQHAVSGGYTLRDRSGVPAPVQYGDFLILTRTKKAAQLYLDAMAALGIPVFFSGQRMLADIPQVQRIAAFPRYLLDPDDLLSRQLSYTATRQYLQPIRQCPWSDFPPPGSVRFELRSGQPGSGAAHLPRSKLRACDEPTQDQGAGGKIVILALSRCKGPTPHPPPVPWDTMRFPERPLWAVIPFCTPPKIGTVYLPRKKATARRKLSDCSMWPPPVLNSCFSSPAAPPPA